MNQIKNKKNQQGFTLVEVIVVAIIVAALAAVAVPMYTSYVTSSRTNAAANAAGSVASFMGSCVNQSGKVEGTGLSEGSPTVGDVAITAKCLVDSSGTDITASSLQLPSGIQFTISKLKTNGTVTAKHLSGGTEQKYNY
ncbi:MAG: hypothetical protein JWO30_3558 [Fibrobacteres bacterium]|nr:hypothetical protein [Fibrobacterota bacterium]